MINIMKWIGSTGIGILLSSGIALAQAPAASATVPQDFAQAQAAVAIPGPIDPDKLVLARQIIAIALPPEHANAMVSRMMGAITRGSQREFSAITHDDPGLNKLVGDTMHEVEQEARKYLIATMPEMSVAMSRAYARNFTHDELLQILAFGQTPAGTKYLSRASEFMQDPDVQAFMTKLMSQVGVLTTPAVRSLVPKIDAYLKDHPELARKINRSKGS
ncbi:DUF2059 domain-containing protein [Novosphingobium sp.]|uniref:DUF2059 domain-containing protein n=1 Tax=Novosphingobium sp. TaxID=1874826 RepID=UPI003342CC30